MNNQTDQELLLEAFVLSNRIDRARIAGELPQMEDTQLLSEILERLVTREERESWLYYYMFSEDA